MHIKIIFLMAVRRQILFTVDLTEEHLVEIMGGPFLESEAFYSSVTFSKLIKRQK